LVAEVKTEYVPGGQAWHAEPDFAPTSDDHVPALQFSNDDPPGTGQYAPAGHSMQSDTDDDPFLDAYVPVAQGVGFTVPSLGQ
jgi:hypothetical protein